MRDEPEAQDPGGLTQQLHAQGKPDVTMIHNENPPHTLHSSLQLTGHLGTH